jgi:hypothetical protein
MQYFIAFRLSEFGAAGINANGVFNWCMTGCKLHARVYRTPEEGGVLYVRCMVLCGIGKVCGSITVPGRVTN